MPKIYRRNTPTERRCPECGGSGDITVRRKAGDPESEATGLCPSCIDGWVRWAHFDPLELIGPLRKTYLSCKGFEPTYRNMRRRAMAAVQLPSDHYADPLYQEAIRDAERAIALTNATLAPIQSLFDKMFEPRAAA